MGKHAIVVILVVAAIITPTSNVFMPVVGCVADVVVV